MIDCITELKQKHFPYRFVKFNRHKHKGNKWITYGIIKSLASRDKMLIKLKQLDLGSPEYLAVKQNLSTYNKILKKGIREAKLRYYHETFEKQKYDISNTWKTISQLLCKSSKAKKSIREIKIEGQIISDTKTICDNFNNFFCKYRSQLGNYH